MLPEVITLFFVCNTIFSSNIFDRMVNCLREVDADVLDVMGYITPIVFDQLTPITAWAPIIGK